MNTHHALRTRRTIHRWKPEPVPAEVIERALEAAHLAPCHKFTWPWTFHVVGPQTRATLVEVGLQAAERKKGPLSPPQREAVRAKLANAGALIVVSQTPCDDPFRDRENYAAISAAIQNMMLSVHADGYGSKWSTGGVTTAPGTYAALGLDAETAPIVGFVWVGVPASVPEVPRPALAQHVRTLP